MARRKLTKNQSRRVKQKQDDSLKRARANHHEKQDADLDNAQLGPEQIGLVSTVFGSQANLFDDNGNEIRCHLRASLPPIVAGDRVVWQSGPEIGVVTGLSERNSLLSRPDSYGNVKLIAANVDQILITIAPKPEAFTNLIDRYLVLAEANHVKARILINKSDLIDERNEAFFVSLAHNYRALGYEVHYLSTKQTGTTDDLAAIVADKTSIFVGQSGVGKSSLVKTLMPDHEIRVGDMSHAASKGRHTTTHSQLFHFPSGGMFIDSPGIREFGLWHLTEAEVLEGFTEIAPFTRACRFRNCTHTKEPGCAVLQALKDGEIKAFRLDSFRRILDSLDEVSIKKH